jgi:hypothetical protein
MGQRDWFIVVVVVAALAVVGFYLYQRRAEVPELVQQVMSPDAGLLEEDPPPVVVDLPDTGRKPITSGKPVDGDDILRRMVSGGSRSLDLAGWLANPDIIQRLAAAAKLFSDGKSPRPVLMFVELKGDFDVIDRPDGKILIDPKSYARYDPLIAALTSLEPAYAAKIYSDVRPYFETAFSQVARQGESFDDVLSAAVLRVTSVQPPQGEIELVEKGAIFLYRDPALESLTPAEKQVLRMGPKNVEALQAWLRGFSQAVGLRQSR